MPLHPTAVAFGPALGAIGKVRLAQQLGRSLSQELLVHPVKVPKKLDVLLAGQELENRSFLGADADAFLDFGHLSADIKAGDGGGPGRRLQQAAKDTDGGRFPGAVRSQESKHLPLADFEAQAVDRRDITEILDQVLDDNLVLDIG